MTAVRVFLVRHGEAKDALVDPARPLSDVGRDDASRLAQWCAKSGVHPHEIRHSGILRAAQTAEILAARLAPAGGVKKARGLAPDDDPSDWAATLAHETRSVMLVSHMPFLGELAELLSAQRTPISFSTGALVSFERVGAVFRSAASWSPFTSS